MEDHCHDADSESGLACFLERLLSDGQALVATDTPLQADDAAMKTLAAWEQNARLDVAGDAPEYLPAVAGWAAEMIYSACQFVVCRDIGAEEITKAFARRAPARRSPSTDWSADLVFRQLPEVCRLARHLSPGDPLVRELQALAVAWPLSSVGVGDLGNLNLDSFIEHPGLRQLYADRILASGDGFRLGDTRIDALAREALGAHPELCPSLARQLFPEPSTPPHPLPTL